MVSAVAGGFFSLACLLGASVSRSVTALLSSLLFRTIIVAAVLLVLMYVYYGALLPAGMLLLALSGFAYLMFTEAKLLE